MIEEEEQRNIEKYKNKVYENLWIPCSERLPEIKEQVLLQYGVCGYMSVGELVKTKKGLEFDTDVGYVDNAVAWRPLPEAYKGDNKNE